MDLIDDLIARGLHHQDTGPDLRAMLAREPVTAYIGFDPTAPSLHVGSLLPVLMLARLQQAGHRPVAIIGGGTGLIGDPSGKETERPMLTQDVLDGNLAGLRNQIGRFLDFDGPRGALMIDNAEWLERLNLVEFLRDVGKHFSVNAMVQRDSVRMRLESRDQGISYTEFTYMLMQAYDFLALFDRLGCRLQAGGSDQWGNIVSGCDLVRRVRGETVHGLTFPLMTRSDGKKFGKSEAGNVWLDAELTSPYAFHQFWLNTEDADVVGHLHRFTFLDLPEIAELAEQVAAAPERRQAQRALAREVTRFVHGQDALERAEHATAVLFDGGDLRDLSSRQLEEVFVNTPSVSIPAAALGTADASLVALLADTELTPSRGQARKAIQGGGIYLNDARVTNTDQVLRPDDLLAGAYALLRRGRKAYGIVRIKPNRD